MFKIKFRIVDDFQKLSSITTERFNEEYDQILGYIQICFGTHKEGSYYHEHPLMSEEEGDELLDYWFEKMLSSIILLDSEVDYVAFKEIETINRWIELRKHGDDILINVAIDNACQNNNLFITEKYQFSYIEPVDFTFPYKNLKEQILEASEKILLELNQMNTNLASTRMCKALKDKVDEIKCKMVV